MYEKGGNGGGGCNVYEKVAVNKDGVEMCIRRGVKEEGVEIPGRISLNISRVSMMYFRTCYK